MLSAVDSLRAVYHDLADHLVEQGGVQLLDFHVPVHQLQKPAHVGNLPGLAYDLLFQRGRKAADFRLFLLVLLGQFQIPGVSQLAQHIVLVNVLDNLVQILHAPARPGERPALLLQLRPAAGLVLGQHLLGEVLPEHPHIGQGSLNAGKHQPVEHLFPDEMDLAGAGVALVVGADKVILAVILVGVAGAKIQLGPAVRASDKAGENAGLACLGWPALVGPERLHPLPLSPFDDSGLGVLEYPLVLNGVFHPLFEFQGLGIGLEVHGTARVFPPLQDFDNRAGSPLIQVVRHGPSLLPGVVGGDGEYLIRRQEFCDLHRSKMRRTTWAASSSTTHFFLSSGYLT